MNTLRYRDKDIRINKSFFKESLVDCNSTCTWCNIPEWDKNTQRYCGDLNENGLCELTDLNAWSQLLELFRKDSEVGHSWWVFVTGSGI